LQKQPIARPIAVGTVLSLNLLEAWNKHQAASDTAAMEAFCLVPLRYYFCLTYLFFLLVKRWQQAELMMQAAARLLRDIGLGCTFAEQVAVERAPSSQLGWLLTGLGELPFSPVQQNYPRPGAIPPRKFRVAQCVAARLAHLKDFDLRCEHMKKHSGCQRQGWHSVYQPR
jgi:hypothetical protein